MTSLGIAFWTLACFATQTPPGAPPPGAIVLFGGTDVSEWVHRRTLQPCGWEVSNGELIVNPSLPDIQTKREFGDYLLHLEFWLPLMPDAKDQAKANSGVYHHGRYEVQILDSWNNPTYPFGGCGAIYGQKDPDKDAIKPPENWNTYDFLFTAPVLGPKGETLKLPRLTAWHNGIRIHHNVEIQKSFTASGVEGPRPARGPILLQNHGARIRFRNIWILPLDRKSSQAR